MTAPLRHRLPRLALAAALTGASLAACAESGGNGPGTGNPTAATTDPAASGGTDSGATDAPTDATAPTGPVGPPRTVTVNKTLKDPELGHSVTVRKVIRNAPWPANLRKRGELIGLEVTWTAGDKYTANITRSMIALSTGGDSKYAIDREITKAATEAAHQPRLKEVAVTQSSTGWIYVAVEPAGAPLTLVYRRPAVQISDEGTSIPQQDLPLPLG